MEKNAENILANLVRIGIVSSVDTEGKKARVIFKDKGFVSGWLHVLQKDSEWIPAVDDVVLCLYLPVDNGDGFILGSPSAAGINIAEYVQDAIDGLSEQFSDFLTAALEDYVQSAALNAALEYYVQTSALSATLAEYLPLSGGTMTGGLNVSGNSLQNGYPVTSDNGNNADAYPIGYSYFSISTSNRTQTTGDNFPANGTYLTFKITVDRMFQIGHSVLTGGFVFRTYYDGAWTPWAVAWNTENAPVGGTILFSGTISSGAVCSGINDYKKIGVTIARTASTSSKTIIEIPTGMLAGTSASYRFYIEGGSTVYWIRLSSSGGTLSITAIGADTCITNVRGYN